MRLPILPLLLLPFLELWLMIVIGDEIGALAVIGWLIAMIIIGVNLLRYLGASSVLRAAQSMQSGAAMPAQSLVGGLFKAIGAVLLIVPGFITDALAILCFVPWVRAMLLKRWMAKIAASSQAFAADAFKQASGRYEPGNVYEHQGSVRPRHQHSAAHEPVLIDQQPEPSSETPSSSDAPDCSDTKNR